MLERRPTPRNTPSLHHSIHPFLRGASFPRMMLAVHFFKARAVDMRINLRRRNIGVAEHRLNGSQIRATFEQMGGERMAQGVRRHALIDPRRQRIATDKLPEALPAERLARTIGKNERAGVALEETVACPG